MGEHRRHPEGLARPSPDVAEPILDGIEAAPEALGRSTVKVDESRPLLIREARTNRIR